MSVKVLVVDFLFHLEANWVGASSLPFLARAKMVKGKERRAVQNILMEV